MRKLDETTPAPSAGRLVRDIDRWIVPVRNRTLVRNLARQGDVIRVLTIRDFKAKYKQSLLGPVWLVVQPLALLGAFAVAFGSSRRGDFQGMPYVLFALSGLCVWVYFQAALTMAGASLVTNATLVRRTPCPRIDFPIASAIATLPSLALTLGATLIVAASLGDLSPRIVLLPVALAWLFLFTTAVAAFAAAVTVYFRDMLNALPFVLQIGVFLAPVGYARSGVSGSLQFLIDLNPITGQIDFWRWCILPTHGLDLRSVIFSSVFSVLTIAGAWRFFGRAEIAMADVI